jgi:tRNA threonylcarbamoyl adenosine modification protein (Sua5/YciO/YrdC/YwlC family)
MLDATMLAAPPLYAVARLDLSYCFMSQFFQIHPDNPQQRLIQQAAQIIHAGGIVALPTDSCYALVCHLDDKDAVTRLRRIRAVDDKHHLTLLCRDLAEIALYAKVDNKQYRLLKSATPGPYTLILEATKEVPRRVSHPSRKTIGLRVPENRIAHALLEQLAQPLLGTTLILPGGEEPLNDAETIRERLEKRVDLVIDGGACSLEPTTVVDLTGEQPVLVREGRGAVSLFGF